MNDDAFAEWFRRQGVKVVRSACTYWAQLARGVYQAIPYWRVLDLGDEELDGTLRTHRAIALRYSGPLTATQGKLSYHVILDDPKYSIDSLPKKARYDVRKGMAYATIREIEFDRLRTEGWLLRQQTLQRQGREQAENHGWWQQLCDSAKVMAGFEAWGALHNDTLVASLIACSVDDCVSILYHQSLTEHLRSGSNNALAFQFVRLALQRPGVNRVFYGLHSLDAPGSVDDFKFRMGFRALPVRQRVAFHPRLRPMVNRGSLAVVRSLRVGFLHNNVLAKAEGMISFYLDGLRPLEVQAIPEVLRKAVR